jgi:2-methylisocitrate lyase-like PEP mutase family enzyme
MTSPISESTGSEIFALDRELEVNVSHKDKVKIFAKLHQEKPFILANAWDAASARTFERAGFKAIGTTSAGIAASRGYRDGQNIPLEEMVKTIREIVEAVNLPVSADMEAGYGRDIKEIIDAIGQVVSLGVVGINIEDSTSDKSAPLADITSQSEKIRAIRQAFPHEDLWINARIDVLYLGLFEPKEAAEETIRRAHAYIEVGANSVFIFGTTEKELLSKFAQEIQAPINFLAGPKMPTIDEMKSLGIARVSLGSTPMRATLGLLEEISKELLGSGTYQSLTKKAIPYATVQNLFSSQ